MKRMIAAAVLALPGLALGQEMRPGLWEYTTSVARSARGGIIFGPMLATLDCRAI